MHSRESTRPFLLFFLLLPYGISTGFASHHAAFFSDMRFALIKPSATAFLQRA